MPIYLCRPHHSKFYGVVAGENAADAVLAYDHALIGGDAQNEAILDCDDSINNYCEKLLTEYEVKELHRHDVLEWVERRLDGDETIKIML